MAYLIVIPIALLVVFVTAFSVAGLLDYLEHCRRRRDLFYQLTRDHNKRRRPAAK